MWSTFETVSVSGGIISAEASMLACFRAISLDDGSFVLDGLIGEYQVTISASGTVSLHSITAGRRA